MNHISVTVHSISCINSTVLGSICVRQCVSICRLNAFQSVLFDGSIVTLCTLDNFLKRIYRFRFNIKKMDIGTTFHNSAISCEPVFESGPSSMHMTRNLSLFSTVIWWPCCKTTLMAELAPGAKTPVLGRTRNLSGDVVFTCRGERNYN